jgi:hypothetical protein
MTGSAWLRWHDRYDEPGSSLQRRLARVRARVSAALDACPPGQVRVLSMCAGQGLDLIPVLAVHRRRTDVRALLVELDPANAAAARVAVRAAGLRQVTVTTGDAALTSAYADVVPVGVALVCGVFGNISDGDVRGTVHALPMLLRPGATVIWTRHRGEPDLTPAIRGWLADAGFTEAGFDTEPGYLYGVGTHVLTGPPQPFSPQIRLFRFEGDGGAAFA